MESAPAPSTLTLRHRLTTSTGWSDRLTHAPDLHPVSEVTESMTATLAREFDRISEVRWCDICGRGATSGEYRSCSNCADRLWAQLDELTALRVELSVAEALIPRNQGEIVEVIDSMEVDRNAVYLPSRKPKCGPKSPARDEVLVLLDPRRGVPSGSIAGVLGTWSNVVAEETGTIAGEIEHLRVHWDHIQQRPWLEEFAAELRRLISRARRAVGVTGMGAHSPVGRCPTAYGSIACGGPLWYHKAENVVACGKCRTEWNGDDLADAAEDMANPQPRERKALTTHEDQIDLAVASVEYGVKKGTLRQWIARNKLTRDSQGYISRSQLVSLLSI